MHIPISRFIAFVLYPTVVRYFGKQSSQKCVCQKTCIWTGELKESHTLITEAPMQTKVWIRA